MPKKRRRQQRPFNPRAMDDYAAATLPPRIGAGAPVFRFTIVIPVEQVRPISKAKATLRDLETLEEMLVRHFRGLSTLPSGPGYGQRDSTRPELEPEMNFNAYLVVYSAPVREADNYFRALQRELQDALDEGVILIEKQLVFLV